ncbi:MAG: hypothetical protein V4805_08335 [Pseudomonadota bacterium]
MGGYFRADFMQKDWEFVFLTKQQVKIHAINWLAYKIQQVSRLQRRFAGFHGLLYTCAKIQYMHRKTNRHAIFKKFEPLMYTAAAIQYIP